MRPKANCPHRIQQYRTHLVQGDKSGCGGILRRAKHVRKPGLRARQISEGGKPDANLPKSRETSKSSRWTQVAALGRVTQHRAGAASPTDAPNYVRPSRKAIPFPSVNETARYLAVRTKQQERPSAIARQLSPYDTQNRGARISALQLHVTRITVRMARQPHRFHDPAVVSLIFPDQQIRDSAWIVEIASHKPCGDYGHVFAVEPCPETKKAAIRSAPLFSLLHRLIPVIALSSKVPVTGSIRKESVKVRTPKSPPTTDYAPLDLSTPDIFPHRAGAEAQHFRCIAQC